MLKPLLSFLSLLLTVNSYAQIYLNPGVDTSFTKVKSALKFYNNYISEFKGRKLPDMSKYWSADELNQRKVPDQLIYALNDSPLYSQGYQRTIIYVRPTDNYVQIKTQFSSVDSSKNIMTMAITNHYIKFNSNNEPQFINPITTNTVRWQHTTIRNVTYFYPPYHKFNSIDANKLITSVVKLENEWDIKPIAIRYYFADDNDELYKLRGFDYALLMGNALKPSGISDDKDNQVFCGGLNENYFHEVVHLYLNHLYPKSPIQEGLAVLYAGSMGHAVKWHLKRVDQYLSQHPKSDLSKLDDFWYTDPYTNPGSAIQGMICSLVYKKDGVSGLKRIMKCTSYKDIFENEFQVSVAQMNTFLRKTIHNEAQDN